MTSSRKVRNPVETRARIMATAFGEIYREGFRGASVNGIIRKARVTKGAFFHHFPTKEALGYAIVDEMISAMVLERWIRPLDDYENAIEGIVRNFRYLIEEMPEAHLGLGCPLNNLVQEMAPIDPVFSRKLNSVVASWIDGTEMNLKKAQMRGYLRSTVDPRRLAEFIVTSQEGAFGMVKMLKNRKAFLGLHSSLKEYLESLQVNGRRGRRLKRPAPFELGVAGG